MDGTFDPTKRTIQLFADNNFTGCIFSILNSVESKELLFAWHNFCFVFLNYKWKYLFFINNIVLVWNFTTVTEMDFL